MHLLQKIFIKNMYITKSLYIKSDNSLEWWRENGKLNINETENNNGYDPANEIALEWWTEEAKIMKQLKLKTIIKIK